MNQGNSVIVAPENPGAETIRVPVLKIFDGDGFLTRIKTCEFTGNPRDKSEFEVAVRFGFTDAPEMGQPGWHEAKEFLATLIGDKWIELVILTKMDTGKIIDRHKRIVCVPFLTEEYSAGEFTTSSNRVHNIKTFGMPLLVTRNVELEMVLNGWTWVLERYGPDARYLEALDDAQRYRRGIWALENNIPPWKFKQRKHQEMRIANKTTTRCPREGCGGDLVRRQGKFGWFVGCSTFPACKYSCSAAV